MRIRIAILALCLAFAPASVWADVKPHAICSEGMVLQQNTKAKIWGTADKGEKVIVTFVRRVKLETESVQEVTTQADDSGRWAVEFNTYKAGGPFELTIKGNNTITYKNILVGEVWVCSGQSNMEWSVNGCDKTDQEYAKSAPHNPMLRVFAVKKSPETTPQSETSGKWIDADPKTVGNFTAAGYFFGRHLNENLKVPVGLIQSAWGGTRIETWMNEATLNPFEKAPAGAKPGNANGASQLYNGMIYPILNYRVKGAIWYQGESNAGNAAKYRAMHPAMIEQWRADFKNPELAFHFVQLAPYQSINPKPGESTWAELREAQLMTLALKNTGMAVITDLGDEGDIHPTPKRPVGERLALAARATTYGEKIVYSGPIYKSVKFDGNKAVLTFDHVGGGLVGKEMVPTRERKTKSGAVVAAWRVKEGANTSAPLIGFTMAGKDKAFHNAKAEIVGDTVVVTSDAVAEPSAVRFGWAQHPLCNLFNREGLPASPFRTDAPK